MATVDRWTEELMLLQEAFVWLVPDEALARILVTEAGLPTEFIDFSEPVYLRIRRILQEASKRNMMVQLLATLTGWYEGNPELIEAIAAWNEGEDRKTAAAALFRASRSIEEPKVKAVVTKVADRVEKVEVEVLIPDAIPAAGSSQSGAATTTVHVVDAEQQSQTIAPAAGNDAPVVGQPPKVADAPPADQSTVDKALLVGSGVVRPETFVDEPQPGDWFSMVRTVSDQERRLRELETWRQSLSKSPTIVPDSAGTKA